MSNVLKYQRAETTRQVTSTDADYQAALDLSLAFSTEVELYPLLEKLFVTACKLVPVLSGLRFEAADPGSTAPFIHQIGGRAHHSMTFQLTHRTRELGELTFFHRRRASAAEIEHLEDLVSIVIQPLHVAQQLQRASDAADQTRRLEQKLTQHIDRQSQRQALLVIRIDSDGDSEPARTRIVETLSTSEEEPWLEVCDDHTLVTLVSVENAYWAAERIRLLIAAAAEINRAEAGTDAGFRVPAVTITISNLRNPGEAGRLLQKSLKILGHQSRNRGNQIFKIA